MPADEAPGAPVDNAAMIAAFIAEGHEVTEPTAETPEAAKTEGETPEGEAAAEGETPETPEAEPEAEVNADDQVYDTVAIVAAIEAKDPKALIEALGDAAEELLGAKAHKALRLQATEIKKASDAAKKFEERLEAKYGDPVKARKAASEGDINAFLECVERQFGAPWTAMVTAVNEALKGKPARIENVAETAKRADMERTSQRDAAVAKVRADITRVVGVVDKALAKACPRIVDMVYEKMRVNWDKGINTPAKALALVKKDLSAEHKELTKIFAPPKPKTTKQITPPRAERATPGRPQTDAEMREEFLRAEGLWRGN